MKKEQKIRSFIKKLLRGKIKKDELTELNQWYDSFNMQEEIIVENQSGDKETIKKKMLSELLDDIIKNKRTGLKIFPLPNYYLRVAASIAFLIILSTTVIYFTGKSNTQPDNIVLTEKITALGEKSIVELSDGSKITLNAGSKIKYPGHFGAGPREIYLEGEAYFEVSSNKEKPFIVHTGSITTIDLGTKFNIKAFKDIETITVSLIEGQIKITEAEINSPKNGIVLEPDQQFIFNKNEKEVTVNDFEPVEVIGWIDNTLVFHKEPLKNVLASLTRMYGIEFELADNAIAGKEITANFQNEPSKIVSETLKQASGLDYRIINENNIVKKIVFYKTMK
jgi:transmembrane sensor